MNAATIATVKEKQKYISVIIEELQTCIDKLMHREEENLSEMFESTVLRRAKSFSFFQKDDILEAETESSSSGSEGEFLEMINKRTTKHHATIFNNEQLV